MNGATQRDAAIIGQTSVEQRGPVARGLGADKKRALKKLNPSDEKCGANVGGGPAG